MSLGEDGCRCPESFLDSSRIQVGVQIKKSFQFYCSQRFELYLMTHHKQKLQEISVSLSSDFSSVSLSSGERLRLPINNPNMSASPTPASAMPIDLPADIEELSSWVLSVITRGIGGDASVGVLVTIGAGVGAGMGAGVSS